MMNESEINDIKLGIQALGMVAGLNAPSIEQAKAAIELAQTIISTLLLELAEYSLKLNLLTEMRLESEAN